MNPEILQNKIILIVDRINNSYLENKEFLEYVNLTIKVCFCIPIHILELLNHLNFSKK
jgi:hypothetical protein